MHPVKRVEHQSLGPGAGIGRRGEEDLPVFGLPRAVLEEGSAGHIAGKALDAIRLVRFDNLRGADRESRPDPGEELIAELLGESSRAMEAAEHEAAEPLLHPLDVGLREREEFALLGEDPVGDQRVDVWVEAATAIRP